MQPGVSSAGAAAAQQGGSFWEAAAQQGFDSDVTHFTTHLLPRHMMAESPSTSQQALDSDALFSEELHGTSPLTQQDTLLPGTFSALPLQQDGLGAASLTFAEEGQQPPTASPSAQQGLAIFSGFLSIACPPLPSPQQEVLTPLAITVDASDA